ncbi:aspartate/glutamate racemase family protein [Cytobacillus purgationiresistens]|uniref:Glutamate racemase n=1 Tax=Cytobacillus purgationiresistens TaxID=863449 RepID=A0ABU0AKH9_9BACI|nr:aspartate/glutamate racemase family protein [Cytobacillus purgationiresistens]MDQ0271781.1 glutamate racemase [Cytobacillus purgationiresistens]
MKVALIHATTTALKPIEEAFRKVAPEIELLHFMDTYLLSMLEKSGSLTPEIARRFSKLVTLAAEAKPDCIQLTCSAFNPLTAILQPLYGVKMFRSDEAMLDEALLFERIGLISTVKETPAALIDYLQEKQPDCTIESVVDPGIIHLLFEGKQSEHDERVREMIEAMDGKVDVIVLSQYSMAHVAEQVQTTSPLLIAPEATALRCFQYILQK